MSQPGSADGIFTRWLAILLSCFGQAQRSGSVAVTSGVEREMKVAHNQPHLVPPMKLVFYDEMPKSPGPSPCSVNRMSHWVSRGKELASKASIRASLIIKKQLSMPDISAPLPVTTADRMSPCRQQFRPLELSIYLPGNRLSDLPGFEHVAFTDLGEIQVPPKALIRTRSENMLPPFSQPQTTRPTISMVGERQLDYWQQQQQQQQGSSPLVSQPPPSAFEPLNSHPICWSSLPGLPPQSEAAIELLEEEEPSSVPLQTADNTTLDFPPLYAQEQEQNRPATTTLPPPSIRIPYKKPLRPTPSHDTSSSSNRTRISHWLSHSSTTTKAPKPSQFYQCAITPPLPQREYQHQHQHSHTPSHNCRSPSFTSSSSSSLGSPIDSDSESIVSMTSSTTAPTTVLDSRSWSRSRSATLRTLDSGMGKKNLRVGAMGEGAGKEEGDPVPDIPDMSVYAKIGRGEVREAGRAPASSQGVGCGVAF
ncbi:hypothetical protein EPUS_06350 [Endocarpon pusillum Z07020]|uniref:Uncharacterized protein n=1 Tax=Endocarpon pusillum (strain Z07020 / HMAS-L-300199) TaxID=1263415 RepID=U1HMR0_ENDPU|nr:uncharacterized protein EPUS_06350 [Endocarpon pusillum Z07020]ERF70309.1 hypothetical protein EPUS_06350 [Endocarpon pusillum Z07020]